MSETKVPTADDLRRIVDGTDPSWKWVAVRRVDVSALADQGEAQEKQIAELEARIFILQEWQRKAERLQDENKRLTQKIESLERCIGGMR